MLALGSGEPDARHMLGADRAGLPVGEVFPILPPSCGSWREEGEDAARDVLHIRHHSLFTPRDFDVSPYFARRESPTLEHGFDLSSVDLE